MRAELKKRVFRINDNETFLGTALDIFNFQKGNNPVYSEFIRVLGKKNPVKTIADLPFLPVEFFRNKRIITGNNPVETIFESSGTTGISPGRHFVSDLGLYEESFLKCFRLFYGDPEDYLLAALLPSYTERAGSSLVYMAERLIGKSRNQDSGFYKDNTDSLLEAIRRSQNKNRKILLLGVSFALLDLAENYYPDLSGVIVMETGGMKGRRKELTRTELHDILKKRFKVPSIHSEYGMTELMSQAYSEKEGIFYCPPWMKVVIRDPLDPLCLFTEAGHTGGINIIDLANINSCSFIATSDLGRIHDDGGFEVLGRIDNSDIRGCNLLAE